MATNNKNETQAPATVAPETQAPATVAPETQAPVEEKVEIYVPKGYANDEPNLFIGVNGVNYLLPKGKSSKVPKAVAEEFYRSQKAQETRDSNSDKLLEASK